MCFPRSLFQDSRAREELKRTGVYVLWGTDTSEQFPTAYVGEADVLLPRLDSHAKDKDFWTHALVFTSKDQNLNKAHVRYLEARLLELAAEVKRCELDNANNPKVPTLSEADTADAESYLTDMLLCLPLMGVHFFEKPKAPKRKTQDLVLDAKGIQARAFLDASGFVVRSGSHAVKKEIPSIHLYLSQRRRELIKQGILKDAGANYRLSQDYTFPSPSTASGVLLGGPSNGRKEWKHPDGRSLKQLQDSQLEETSGAP